MGKAGVHSCYRKPGEVNKIGNNRISHAMTSKQKPGIGKIKRENTHNKDQEKGKGCCIEAVLTVDDRGQIVLPKHIRGKVSLKPRDKIALIVWENENTVCCLGLIKAEHLIRGVRDIIRPMFE
jgi:antitoxin PrlF